MAIRAAPEVSVTRWAERRKEARKCGKNPCQKGLLRDGCWRCFLPSAALFLELIFMHERAVFREAFQARGGGAVDAYGSLSESQSDEFLFGA